MGSWMDGLDGGLDGWVGRVGWMMGWIGELIGGLYGWVDWIG